MRSSSATKSWTDSKLPTAIQVWFKMANLRSLSSAQVQQVSKQRGHLPTCSTTYCPKITISSPQKRRGSSLSRWRKRCSPPSKRTCECTLKKNLSSVESKCESEKPSPRLEPPLCV